MPGIGASEGICCSAMSGPGPRVGAGMAGDGMLGVKTCWSSPCGEGAGAGGNGARNATLVVNG